MCRLRLPPAVGGATITLVKPNRAVVKPNRAYLKRVRLAVCLAMLGGLLVIIGLAAGMSSSGPVGCAAQTSPGQVPASDPCVRGGGGWHDVGYAFIAPGVLALIGAARIGLTAKR